MGYFSSVVEHLQRNSDKKHEGRSLCVVEALAEHGVREDELESSHHLGLACQEHGL